MPAWPPGVALAAVPARAATTTAANIRFVRNPARHNQFGIVIEYAPTVSEQVALVLYPSTFGGTDLPDGFAQGKRAYQELDSFTFNDARFSDRGKYRIAFAVSLAEGRCKIKASFNREGQRTVEAIKGVDLVKFARGEEGLEFVLTTGHAEFFRWDLFGERLEVKGTDGAVLTLKLASPVLERGGLSPWSEPQLDLTLAPHGSSTIWAIKGSVAVKTLRIRKTQGDQGDGARIQEVQELEGFQAGDLGRHGRYRAAAWIGEASELIWRFPKAKDDSSDKDGKKERTRAKKEKEKEKEDLVSVPYDIGDATSPRRRAAIQIAHDLSLIHI